MSPQTPLPVSAAILKDAITQQIQTALRNGVALGVIYAALRSVNDDLSTVHPYLVAASEQGRGP